MFNTIPSKFCFFLLLLATGLKSQINYAFSALTSAYTANVAPVVLHGASVDDGISAATAIGFNFCYGGSIYNTFQASTNGVMFLGTAAAGSNITNNLNTSTDRPAIAPLWDDLKTSTTGNVNYILTGVTPTRILTIEWKNMLWNYAAAGPVISFQVKLYETTNRIDFCYLQNATAVNLGSASIGLGGQTSGDFYSLNGTGAAPAASKVTETSNLSTRPATNQVYRWVPAICAGVPTGGAASAVPSSSCVAYNTTLSLSGATSACGITYQWQSAAAPGGPWSNISGATLSSTVVNVTSTTYYRCVLACGVSTAASSSAIANLTPAGACGICNQVNITLPYTMAGQTTCGSGNNITSSNVTNVCGSTLYYGGEDITYAFTPSSTGVITINVTSTGSYMGITLYSGCPLSGGSCVANAQSSAGNQSVCVNVTSGQAYYLVLDSWPAPTCNPYAINISAPGPCSGSIAGATAAATSTSGCGSLTSTLSLSGFSACGPSFQWQSSASAGGPFTNIPGATFQTYPFTSTVSTYYQALLSCGASTALSNVIQTNVTQTTAPACSLSTYTSATTTYSFEVFTGTVLPTTDDVLFNTIVNFGFSFCFTGAQYWGGYVASNAAFVFDAVPCYPNISSSTYAAGGVGTGFTISGPAPVNGTSIPRNAILAPWHDINPGSTATVSTTKIQYITTGTAPNRKFVLSYEDIPMYSAACETVVAQRFSAQIKIFETTNAIEIHIKNKQVCSTWNDGQAVMGLHNFDGTVYVPPVNATAHNATAASPYNNWTMTNTAYKFQSPCAVNGGPCSVLPISFKSFYGEQVDYINRLYWETAEEADIKEFIVERSTDAINFTPIGSVNPNNMPSKYIFNDNTFRTDIINYYRITAIENNNQRKSTFIYPLGGNLGDLVVSDPFPNPAKQSFSISIISKKGMNVNVNIYDMYGNIVEKNYYEITAGITPLNLNSASLESGVYIIKIEDALNKKALSQRKLIIAK